MSKRKASPATQIRKLRKALRVVQDALAAHRDDQPFFLPYYGEVCLEEVKYLVVDPALDNG
jgi:hypothetical protein